jgi:hypothetical protein
MKKREILTNPLIERRVFFLVAIIYLIPVGMFKYVGSLDGPQHLLTSNIIAGLLSGSDFYGQFFQFNPPVIGNSLGNYILGVLNLILPAWMAEKILLISYLMAFFYGFRYLVVSIKGKADYKLLVIFPFAFHTLFLLGYYNYSIAVAFMFFSLGYLIRKDRNRKPATFIILTLLFTLTYYAHVVVFGILLLLSATYLSYNFICERIDGNKRALVKFLKRVVYYSLAVLPGVVLTWFYYSMMPDTARSPVSVDGFNRIQYLLDFDLLVVFFKETGNHFSRVIMISLLIAVILILITRSKKTGNPDMPEGFVKGRFNFWLFASVLLFAAFFFVPNHMSLPVRMAIPAVLLLIVWIAIQETHRLITLGLVVLINLMSAGLRYYQMSEHHHLDEMIREIVAMEDQIPDNTLVYTANYSDNWVMYHFENYLGTEKKLVDLNSPSVNEVFAVNWKSAERPFLFMGARNSINVSMVNNKSGFYPVMVAEYVLIFDYDRFKKADDSDPLAELIRRDFQEISISPNRKVGLLKFNRWPEVNQNKQFILENEMAKAGIEKKAREFGIPFEDALLKDALWLYDTSAR